MSRDLGHGPRISGEEYDRRIVRLYTGRPPVPSPEEDRQIRRAELDVTIDHRLGVDFPPERRDQLWRIRQETERRRLWLGLRYLVRRILRRRDLAPTRAATGLARFAADRYAEVLSEEELESFLGTGSSPSDEE